jgi:hypothetical protein
MRRENLPYSRQSVAIVIVTSVNRDSDVIVTSVNCDSDVSQCHGICQCHDKVDGICHLPTLSRRELTLGFAPFARL